ncbi:MAG TPA: TRAM domain-containing protein [Candidatus Nanoarchaeia archaeon]|nr:TRAM domain-containing protein [Candidatus Nanoarchaeia archaeon]
MDNQEAPVKVGEIHEVEIKSIGEKGDGIARVNGFVLFVPGVRKGDYVKIKITKVLPKVGFAEVVEKSERPMREPRYDVVNQEEIQEPLEEEQKYEDTEDFGEESDEK